MSAFDYSLIDVIAEIWFDSVLHGIMKTKGRKLDHDELAHGIYKELEPILNLLFGAESENAWNNSFHYYWEDPYNYTLILSWETADEEDDLKDYEDYQYNYTAGCA